MSAGQSQVLQDLHLLFATDNQLHDDLTYVCSLISTSEVASKSINDSTRTSKNVSHTDKRKQEILELRRQVDILKDKLLETQQKATGKPDMSLWERAARDQVYAYSKSLNENERLHADIEANATFIEEMTFTLRKKPRLSLDIHSEEWKTYKLAAQASLRTAAIHAIADHQYKLLESAFIKAGLIECSDEIIRDEYLELPDGRIMPERVYHVTLAAPFRLIGAAAWKVFCGEHPMQLPEGAEETLENIDPYTVYQTIRTVGETVAVHSNMIYKYFVEVDREVIVWRSVLEDALMPHMTEGAIQNKWGWLVLTPTNDPAACRMTYVHQVSPFVLPNKSPQCEHAKRKEKFMEKYGFIQPPQIPGTFPGGDVNKEMEIPIPFVRRTFVERDKALELALKRVIDQVVLDFQQINPPITI